MGFIRRLFGKAEPDLVLDHPVFGQIRFLMHEGDVWQNSAFTLWSAQEVDLQIHAGHAGPTNYQTEEFVRFRDAKELLWPRCLAAVEALQLDLGVPPGTSRITGLSIPSFEPKRAGKLWTLWIDLEGDDQFGWGVQTNDAWQTIVAIADD